MILRTAAALVLLTASAAAAEEPILSIQFGPDHLDVAPEQIVSVELRLSGDFPDVLVTLDPSLQFDLASLTLVHVGQIGAIKVCGRVVSEPTLRDAIREPSFIITNGQALQARRLAAILSARSCDEGGNS